MPTDYGPQPAQRAALLALAADLDPGHYSTALETDGNGVPYLLVSSRHAQPGEAIDAGGRSTGGPGASPSPPSPTPGPPPSSWPPPPDPPMGDRPPAPGYDEILVTAPSGRCLCNSREHARLNCLADVVVTFGELGTRWATDALWQSNWGRSFPLCQACWDSIRRVAAERRPGLVITATTSPQTGRSGAGGPRGVRP